VQALAWGRFRSATDGEAKFVAFREAAILTWPEFLGNLTEANDNFTYSAAINWNPWLERNIRAFCNTTYAVRRGDSIFRSVTLTGCGGAGKTHAAMLYAIGWWMVDPANSIVTLTSTTVPMIRQRMWPVISHYWSTAIECLSGKPFHELGALGDKVDSQLMIKAAGGAAGSDAKHSISALAVAHGETAKAVHNLKGRHAPRMLLIVDEANGTEEAILQCIPNMRKGCRDITIIIIGNPSSRLDSHGRALTPEDGWGSIGEDSIEWRTRGVPDWQLEPGVALRFDGFKSPNVLKGKTHWPFIYTLEDKQHAESTPNYIGTPNYFYYDRGLHLPEGTTCTVFSEQLFMRCLDGSDQHFTFDGDTTMLAFLDPAFTAGGDEAYFQVAKMGQVAGKWCIQLLDGFAFPISPEANAYDVDYQLARRMQQECTTRRIAPHCSGVDCTGGGRSVGAILAAEWSDAIHYQTWGGAASELPSAEHDGQLARDSFANRVTELWWNVRAALENGQVLGFSREAMAQGCARLYTYQGRKIKIEPKDEMKLRVRYSPDRMDAIAGLVAVAMVNGFSIEGKASARSAASWQAQARATADPLGIGADGTLPSTATAEGGWAEESLEDQGAPAWADAEQFA
jgi:hypothetical protein